MDFTTYAELENKNIKILVEGSQRAIKTNTHIIHKFSQMVGSSKDVRQLSSPIFLDKEQQI